jgi:hypothetical protein
LELSSEDQRSQRRVEAAIAIRVLGVDSAGQSYDDAINALEVSRRGLSFLTRHNLALFASLIIIIPGRGPVRLKEGHRDFFTEATVVRSVKENEQFYRVGIRFMGATLPMYCPEGI